MLHLAWRIAELHSNASLPHGTLRRRVVFQEHLAMPHLWVVEHLGHGIDRANTDVFIVQKSQPFVSGALPEESLELVAHLAFCGRRRALEVFRPTIVTGQFWSAKGLAEVLP